MDRVIVVGGGLAGLATSAILARRGVPVRCLEAGPQLGGRARTRQVDPGYDLNLGPHALARSGPGTALLRELGVALDGGSPPLHRTRLLVDGEVVGPFRRAGGAGGVRTLPAFTRLVRDAKRGDPDGSVADWLAATVPDRRVRSTLTPVLRLATYSDGLDQIAADVAAESLRQGGVIYLDGGWRRLIQQLRTIAVRAGAEVSATAPVRGLGSGADGIDVRLADDHVQRAAAVVLAVGGPAEAASVLPAAAAAHLREHADRIRPVRMATLDVALTEPPAMPPLVFGTDEPWYLSVHSEAADLAPAGGSVLHVARFLTPGERAPVDTRDQLRALLDRTAPGWRHRVVDERFLPELTVTHDGGTVASGGRRGRHPVTLAEAPGVFVAGDWVGSTGTLAQATLASAKVAAARVVTHVRGRDTERVDA